MLIILRVAPAKIKHIMMRVRQSVKQRFHDNATPKGVLSVGYLVYLNFEPHRYLLGEPFAGNHGYLRDFKPNLPNYLLVVDFNLDLISLPRLMRVKLGL